MSTKTRLYLVNRPECGYDEAAEFVVRANNPKHARTIAACHCGDEGAACWKDPKHSKVKWLRQQGVCGLICRDFLNG